MRCNYNADDSCIQLTTTIDIVLSTISMLQLKMRITYSLLLALFFSTLSHYISPCTATNHVPSSVTVYINPDTASSECNTTSALLDTYHCRSLVSAVSSLILNNDNPPQNIDIFLSTGVTHYLTKPLSIEASNITIGPADSNATVDTGTSDHSGTSPTVTIACSITESVYTVDGIVPVLQFPAVDFVHIHDVQFERCPGGVFVNNASKLVIERAEFRYFTNGAVDVYNTIDITVMNTSFKHNGPLTNHFKLYGRYVVHSGGLSVGADILDSSRTGSPRIHIESCSFINNSAIPSDAVQQTLTQVFIRELFTGRGGALGMALNSPLRPYTVIIRNCSFSHNSAKLLGGAVYITLGFATSHDITFDTNVLIENESGFAGGGTFVGSFGPGTETEFDSIVFMECLYIRNKADRGGGAVYAVPGTQGTGIWNYMLFDSCEFISNKGKEYAAALWLASVDPYATQFNHKPVEVVNCIFTGNSAPDSTIMGTLFVPIVLSGRTVFAENQGSALELFGSIADFTGTIEFINTDSQLSNIGALHLVSFAQIWLREGVTILFKNNSGKFGASITTESEAPWEGFSHLIYNPLCFFLYEVNKTPPDEWNVNVSFIDNTAVVGSVGYIDSSSPCSWGQHDPPYFNSSNVLNWKPFNQKNNSNTFHTEDNYYTPVPNTQTYPMRISVTNNIVHAYLGEVFALDIRAYDQLNNSVGIAVTLTATSNSANVPLHFSPSAALFTSDDQLLYTQASTLNGIAIIEQDYTVEVRGFNQKMAIQSASFLLKLEECPPGYFLQNDGVTTKCMCTVKNKDVFHCTGTTITLNKRVWATKDVSSVDHISVYICPPGYCKCVRDETTGACMHLFDSSDTNGQCACHRSGILCGECNSTADSSLTVLSYSCVTDCVVNQWSMITIIVIWGIMVCVSMAFIVRVFIHQVMPSTLFPILYYIQLLSIGFSSTLDGFNPVFIYLYYVYSLLSFYFPYDFCFPNIGPILLHSFKFLPLILAIIIIPITLLLSWKWLKVSNRPWYSVWLVLLLLYTHSLSSAISVLYCPSIPDETSRQHRWYIAGHIECFRSHHLLLSLLAMIVIIVCCLSIIFTLVMPIMVYRHHQLSFVLKRLMEPLIDFHSTKGSRLWFFSYDLFRRFLPTVMANAFPGNKYSVFIVFLLMNSVIVYWRPYRSTATNNTESLLLVTTAIMYIVSIQEFSYVTIYGDTSDRCSAYASVSLSTIVIALLYYVPVVLAVIFVMVAIFKKLQKIVKGGSPRHRLVLNRWLKKSQKPSQQDVEEALQSSGSYVTSYVKRDPSITTIEVSSSV